MSYIVAGSYPATEQLIVTQIFEQLVTCPTVTVPCCTEVYVSPACLGCPNQLLLDLSMPIFTKCYQESSQERSCYICTRIANAQQAFAQSHIMPACGQTLALQSPVTKFLNGMQSATCTVRLGLDIVHQPQHTAKVKAFGCPALCCVFLFLTAFFS